MSGFHIQESRDDRLGRLYLLEDEDSGSRARIAPEWGANLHQLTLPSSGGPIDLLLGPDPGRDATHFGIPILFPFPNRLHGGRFSFQGREYQLDTDSTGNAIHGFVRNRPWRVEDAETLADAVKLRVAFDSSEHASVLRQFPFPFRLEVTFTLSKRSLRIAARATNQGEAPMPMGFGLHPWFCLPLEAGRSREDYRLRVPASSQWELTADKLPTGRVIPVPPEKDFRSERALGDLLLDDGYTDIVAPGECALISPDGGTRVVVRYDEAFRELVIYAPATIPTLCMEPYSCATDAFNLASRGIDGGMVVLEAGGDWRGVVEIALLV
jgi:aldose 1-epimerase